MTTLGLSQEGKIKHQKLYYSYSSISEAKEKNHIVISIKALQLFNKIQPLFMIGRTLP